MFTYEDQVLDATDADGMLSTQLASRLITDHNTSLYQMISEGYKGNARHAESLLEFLGYWFIAFTKQTNTANTMLIYSVHLISNNKDHKFASFDCYWHAVNTCAELVNEFQLPLDTKTEIRAMRLDSV